MPTRTRSSASARLDDSMMPRSIDVDLRAVVTRFVYNMWNGLVEPSLLSHLNYRQILNDEPSAAEEMVAVFLNVLTLDADGHVTNAREAEVRAAQYLRSYCEPAYEVDPPFEQSELVLHAYGRPSSGPMP